MCQVGALQVLSAEADFLYLLKVCAELDFQHAENNSMVGGLALIHNCGIFN